MFLQVNLISTQKLSAKYYLSLFFILSDFFLDEMGSVQTESLAGQKLGVEKLEDVWKIALDEFKKELPGDFFEPFIKPLYPITTSKTEGTIIFAVPDGKIISHLKGHYKTSIQSKLKSLMGRDVTVDFQEITKINPGSDHTESETKEMNGFNPSFTFENFIISPSNEMAFSGCQSILSSKKTSNLLFLSGKSGNGKTHLIQATVHKIYEKNKETKIYYASSQEFKEQYLNSLAQKKVIELKNYLKSFDVLILEDLQLLGKSSESTQEEFFYLFNNFYESGKSIILSADRPVAEIQISDRLKSRFLSGITAEISVPDYKLRYELIERSKKFLDLSEDAHKFLCESITDNVRMIESALKMIQFLKSRSIDINNIQLLSSHLKGLLVPAENVPVDSIVEHICSLYGVSREQLFGKSRKAEITLPRHLAMYLALKLSGLNKSSLARYFKKSDHTIIINAEKKIKKLAEKDPRLNRMIESSIKKLWKNRG